MKCLACDVILTDFESTRRYHGTQYYVELCNHCFKHIAHDINTDERMDLLHSTLEEAYEDEVYQDESL